MIRKKREATGDKEEGGEATGDIKEGGSTWGLESARQKCLHAIASFCEGVIF